MTTPHPISGAFRAARAPVALGVGVSLLVAAMAAVFLLLSGPSGGPPPSILGIAGAVLGGIFAVAWATRLALWWIYRPMEPTAAESSRLPRLTLVIPAFNEGRGVERAIDSVLASDYPADRLDVIVVDDGSTDDTATWIAAAARRHPDRLRAVHLPRNRGKRHALYEGFRRARGEVVATLDSDSIVPPDSLAKLVTPIVRDARIAAVAGKVMVHNRRDNLLTRMLAVRYVLGFDLVRAYQSQLRTVWCCPGALQAYRRAAIRPHLRAWRDQTFLGARCTNGDDHAMTNLVLSLGHDAVYQSNAVVETLVPTTYRRLCKMFVRWGRSATREGLRAMRFAPRRALQHASWRGPLILLDALMQPLTIGLQFVGLAAAAFVLFSDPFALAQGALATTAFALIYCAIYLRSDRSWNTLFGLLYAWFAMVALVWVQPYATVTVRRNGWLTRG